MRKIRISETIGKLNQKYIDEATAYAGEAKAVRRTGWKKWGAVAACFALAAVTGIGVFQSGLLGIGEQIVTLDNGNKINFVKSAAVGQLSLAFQIETRTLTDSEIDELFGNLPVTAYALFHAEDGSVLGIEGKLDDMKLLVSASGITLNDVIIEGEETASDVDGVSVNAGYFTSGKTVIYYAAFVLGDSTVYIEHAGAESENETVRNEIASAIQKLIALGQIDLTGISR